MSINVCSGSVWLKKLASLGSLFGAESAIRPDSLQRAGALGLLHRFLTMDVEDVEGLEEGAESEDNTRRNGQCGTFNEDIVEQDECGSM